MTNIDTNADNFCGAGIVHTVGQQIGCLYRLEPKKDAKVKRNFPTFFFNDSSFSSFQMYRLTIRTSKEGLANRLAELLEDQF